MAGISLYDYQKDAVRRMKNGCILNGGTGVGKSRTALAYYYICQGGKVGTEDYVRMTNPKDLYIITTARKRDTYEWEGELIPFMMYPFDGNGYSNNVIIDSWNNIKKYKDVENAFFIFDEQRVVGSGTWVKSFLKITKANEWILLSATPGDTWSDYIPVFVANGFYKNRTEFNRKHCVYSRYTNYPKIERYISTGELLKHRNDILISMDSKRSTVQHHEDVYVDYNKQKYKDISKKRWSPWDDKPIETAAEYCAALRRVVNEDESRQIALLEILEKHKRSIIFYSFNYELDILRRICPGNVAEWNGHKHEPIPDTDQWCYLVQYTAGCEGWNCVSTDTIIFYSQSYSWKVMEQSSGRIDRVNTPYRDLYYYHLKSRSGIDLAINKALIEKKIFNERKFYGN